MLRSDRKWNYCLHLRGWQRGGDPKIYRPEYFWCHKDGLLLTLDSVQANRTFRATARLDSCSECECELTHISADVSVVVFHILFLFSIRYHAIAFDGKRLPVLEVE